MPRNDAPAIIIPARYKSSRFPGKPLVDLHGTPMIVRVAEQCAKAGGQDSVFIATDDDRIADACCQHGFQTIMTSPDHPTGTDRIAEAADQIEAEMIINVQGDEPLIRPEDITAVIEAKRRHPDEVINAYCPISADEDPHSNTLPKVVFNEGGRLLYMSRAAVPGVKDGAPAPTFHKQVCIYGFSRAELEQFRGFGRKSRVEAYEDIEILRFFDLGISVRMIEVSASSIAVDRPEDVDKVLAVLAR